MNAPKSDQLVCPDCRGDLLRVRRSFLDRLVGLIVTSRRYRCARSGCGWSGLLQGRVRRHGTYRGHRPLEAARDAPPGPADRRRRGG
jgi:hypothetical protein